MTCIVFTLDEVRQIHQRNQIKSGCGRRLSPVPLKDGRWAVNADILNDPGTWDGWRTVVDGKMMDEIGLEQFENDPLKVGSRYKEI